MASVDVAPAFGGDRRMACEWLSTAVVADACASLGIRPGVAPPGIRPLAPGSRLAGRAWPVRYQGSVESVLAALDGAAPGDLLVIDNGGRTDEACVGDLLVLEAAAAGISGIVVWGCHRDTRGLVAIDLPLFSYGACPVMARRDDADLPAPGEPVRCGAAVVQAGDGVIADDDGVLVLDARDLDRIIQAATALARTEQAQADAIAYGHPLREQVRRPTWTAPVAPVHDGNRPRQWEKNRVNLDQFAIESEARAYRQRRLARAEQERRLALLHREPSALAGVAGWLATRFSNGWRAARAALTALVGERLTLTPSASLTTGSCEPRKE